MNQRILPAAVAALAVFGAVAPTPAAAHHIDTGRLDAAMLEAELDDFADLAGGSVLVQVRDGEAAWTDAAGRRDLAADAPPARPGDRIRIGSATKSMTAAVVLQLAAEGAVDLDAPIGAYLPGLLPYEDDPTVRQLLQHTSGVPDWLPIAYAGLGRGDFTGLREGYRTHYEPEDLIAIATAHPLEFEPGTAWSYSNTGYMVLGLLIEERTGNDLGDELEARVFRPAHMERTYFPKDGTAGVRGPHAVPYVTTGDPAAPYFDATELSNSQTWAAGGVVSTTDGLNSFYTALADGTLLAPEQLAEATAFIETGGDAYGLGLSEIRLDCPEGDTRAFYGHEGDGLGHQTVSYHSLDGERHFTLSWSLDDKAGYGDEDAFDAALEALMTAGLCG